jgi:hypothetical protein
MYKLYNWLFGWDYICWQNSADSGIARVHKSKDNKVFYWRYKITNLIDYLPPQHGQRVTWLTCSPDKYIK